MSDRINWSDPEEAAKVCAGNHRKFTDFGWHERPDDDQDYMLCNIRNRDSSLLDLSNASVLEKELGKFSNFHVERFNHWLCGWVEALVIRVYDEQKKITPAFEKFCELQEKLEDYPILDEQDLCDREHEVLLENIRYEGKDLVRRRVKNWERKVILWLCDHEERELEIKDGEGAYPSRESIQRALSTLGFLKKEKTCA